MRLTEAQVRTLQIAEKLNALALSIDEKCNEEPKEWWRLRNQLREQVEICYHVLNQAAEQAFIDFTDHDD